MVATREEYKQYCLRALGAPVLEINVDEEQLEDRIDEALEYWRLYHHEGIEKIYLKTRVLPSKLTLITNNADEISPGTLITGSSSKATATVCNIEGGDIKSEGNTLYIHYVKGVFESGETITGGDFTAVLADEDFFFEGETDKKYLDIPDIVYGISRVFPISFQTSSKSLFDVQYQLRLNDLYDLTSTSIIYYKMVMSHLALLDLELNGKPMHRFNRLSNRLYIDTNWDSNIIPGTYIVVDAYRAMDPTTFPRIWSEPWLKHYGIALFKRQWAINLKKFSGLQLPGGVSLDGSAMYDEAMNEIKDLEEDLVLKASPCEFFMG